MTDQPAHRRVQGNGKQNCYEEPHQDLTDVVDEEECQPKTGGDEEDDERTPGRDAAARRSWFSRSRSRRASASNTGRRAAAISIATSWAWNFSDIFSS